MYNFFGFCVSSRSDHRANLELVIAELLEMLAIPEMHVDSDYMSDSEGAIVSMECNGKIALSVRKRLAPAIQHLMQHGLMVVKLTSCFDRIQFQKKTGRLDLDIWRTDFYAQNNIEIRHCVV